MTEDNKNILKGGSLFLAIVGFYFLAIIVARVLTKCFNIELNTVTSTILVQGSILLPIVLFCVFTKQNPLKLIRFKKFNFLSALLVIVLVYCMLPLISLANIISMFFATNVIGATIEETMVTSGLLGSLALMAMTPALVEETTFRGAIYNTLKGSRPIIAIIISAFIFGLMHMNFNQMAYAVVLGIIMAIVLEATDSIVATMMMHFIYNGNSVVLLYLLPKMMKYLQTAAGDSGVDSSEFTNQLTNVSYTSDQLLLSLASILPMAIIGTILGVLLIYAIAKLNKRENVILGLLKKQEDANEDLHINKETTVLWKNIVAYIPLILAAVVCIGMCIFQEL